MMKQIYRYILMVVVVMGAIIESTYANVTVSGTITSTANLGGSNQYVVLNYTGGEKKATYRITEVVTRTDAVSRTNDAPADKLYIQLRRESGTHWVDQKITIQSSEDNSKWDDVETNIKVNDVTSLTMFGPYEVSRKTKYIRIKSADGSKDKYHGKVYLTMASYCETDTKTLNYNSDTYLNAADKTFKINWSNKENAQITLSGTDKDRFEILEAESSSSKYLGCSKGKYGYTTVKVRYKRDVVGSHTAKLAVNGIEVELKGTTTKGTPTIDCISVSASGLTYGQKLSESTITGPNATFKDGSYEGTYTWTRADAATHTALGCTDYSITFTPSNTNLNSVSCTVQVPMTKVAQTITWTQSGLNVGDLLLNGSTSGHDAIVYYTSSDPTVATIDGTTLRMVKPGYVTVTAHADATCNYLAAEPVSRDFELSRTRPTVTPNTVNLTYGQALQEVEPTCTATYNGETVAGTFAWVNSAFQPEVGTTTQKARFTPADESRFSAIEVDVKVIVAKASPKLTWRIATTLRSNSVYDQPISTLNTETGVQITTNNTRVQYNAESDRLVVGEFTEKTTVKITVTQSETAHYLSGSATYSIIVAPKSNVCVDRVQDSANEWHVDIADQATYEDALFGYNINKNDGGKVWWCDTNEKTDGKYGIFNVVNITQYKGIALGYWDEGLSLSLSGIISSNGAYIHKSVVLSVSGVPDKISFETHIQRLQYAIIYSATNRNWELYESADLSNWTSLKTWTNGDNDDAVSVNAQLDPSTRYIMIKYKGNFTGFVSNLRITRRHGFEYGADRNKVSQITVPQFGTEAHPLQVPQTVSFRYYSLGSCGSENDSIAVSSSNSAFYADVEGISRSVDFDQYTSLTREYKLTVRCTDIGQTGVITLKATDGTELKINVSSAIPDITATTSVFHTGTEQNQQIATDKYRGFKQLDFSQCFASSTLLFDTLYIFGVTGNTELVRNKFDYYDGGSAYWLPSVAVADAETACNAHTPLFVYGRYGNKYVYSRTISNAATNGLGQIDAEGKHLAFLGYSPYSYTGIDDSQTAFALISATTNADITLIDAELSARSRSTKGTTDLPAAVQTTYLRGDNGAAGSGSVIALRTDATDEDCQIRLHSIGQNMLSATAGTPTQLKASIQGVTISQPTTEQHSPAIDVYCTSTDTRLALTIDDRLNGVHQVSSSLNLIPSAGIGSVDLGNANGKLIIDGGIVSLSNGSLYSPLAVGYRRTLLEKNGHVAIVYGLGEQQYDAQVLITDGTIRSSGDLNMPFRTIVSGGTFADGDILCYEDASLSTTHAVNQHGMEVYRTSVLAENLPADYGHESVIADQSGKVQPMLATTTARQQRIKQWVAATPEASEEAGTQINRQLLYHEITPSQQAYENKTATVQPITNSADYEIDGELSMLMQVDSADSWRMFVAPFDITAAYGIELDAESKWDNLSRQAAVNTQKPINEQFDNFIANYITRTDCPTTLPLLALVNKFLGTNNGATVFEMVHYNGKNFISCDYEIYEVPSTDGTDKWEFDGDELVSKWQPIGAKKGEVLMHKGRTYALRFPFCPHCPEFNGYDYWSGKYIIFQGKGKQTISGTESAKEQIIQSASEANSVALLTGNTSLSNIMLDIRTFTFDKQTDLYLPHENGVTLSPTQSAIFTNYHSPAGAKVRNITRDGKATFEDTTSDTDAGKGIVTGWADLKQGDWKAAGAKGVIVVRTTTDTTIDVYSISGAHCTTLQLHTAEAQEVKLTAGAYILRSNNKAEKVIVN